MCQHIELLCAAWLLCSHVQPPGSMGAAGGPVGQAAAPPAPTGPPAHISMATADVSRVPADQKAILASLNNLFNFCMQAANTPGTCTGLRQPVGAVCKAGNVCVDTWLAPNRCMSQCPVRAIQSVSGVCVLVLLCWLPYYSGVLCVAVGQWVDCCTVCGAADHLFG